MATCLRCLVQAIPYQAESTGNANPELGVGGVSVHVYMDDFFTSFGLLTALKELGHQGTGTIRLSRDEKAPLKSVIEIKEKD